MPDSILDEAAKIIVGVRRNEYGHPLDNHTLTARMWSDYLNKRFPNIRLTCEDVCMLNILQKIARMSTTGKITRDGLVDIAGYAGNVEMIQQEVERRANGGCTTR